MFNNDDAPKRSGVIEKGTRNFQEIVTMNGARMDENMLLYKLTNEACMKNAVEHDESKRQFRIARGLWDTENRRMVLNCG